MTRRIASLAIVALGAGTLLVASLGGASGPQVGRAGIRIDNDDIGGTVTSSSGPEAGAAPVTKENCSKKLPQLL